MRVKMFKGYVTEVEDDFNLFFNNPRYQYVTSHSHTYVDTGVSNVYAIPAYRRCIILVVMYTDLELS